MVNNDQTRKIQMGMARHLNRMCLLLKNNMIYEVNSVEADYIGLNWLTTVPRKAGEEIIPTWVTLEWAFDNLQVYIEEVCKNKYWMKYKYPTIIQGTIRWSSRLKRIWDMEEKSNDGE